MVLAADPPAVRKGFIVTQLQFPSLLVVRGDRVEIGYDAQQAPNEVKIPKATGTLYVRNDRTRRFMAVPLTIRKALQKPSNAEDRRLLRALVPDRLLRGQRLLYYAVIRDRRTGRSVRVPAGGARAPESVWIINRAFRVNLGPHVFGQTETPEVIVGRADPSEVTFNVCEPGGECGQQMGPLSFEVAKDESVWLIDNPPLAPGSRLLVWEPGQPDTVARTLALPFGLEPWNRAVEFALGPAGSLYLKRGGLPTDPPLAPEAFPPDRVTRLSASGTELWTTRIATDVFNVQLRTGPDGTLYWTGPHFAGSSYSARESNGVWPWVPVATPSGQVLSPAAQKRGTGWTQPLPGGLQLVHARAGYQGVDAHETRVALVDGANHVVRAWRLSSPTIIQMSLWATPALVGGDPVVVLEAYSGPPAHKLEYLVLRLGPSGIRARFSLPKNDPPRSAFGNFAITDIRVEPDGKLYQLGSAPDFGAAIYRFLLAPSG